MSCLHLRNLRLPGQSGLHELRIEDGYFVSRFSGQQPVSQRDLDGLLVLPGLIETHIHLDKACIMSRCCLQHGTLAEAVEQTRQAKAGLPKKTYTAVAPGCWNRPSCRAPRTCAPTSRSTRRSA